MNPDAPASIPTDLAYVALLFALFVVPKALQRYRIPSAITALLMGVGAQALGFFDHDATVQLLSTFGIVALFLFAGLEINGAELRRGAATLVQHGLIWTVLLAAVSIIAALIFGLTTRSATLVALALLTPSTGFILSSLSSFGLDTEERFAVKSKAVAAELLALAALFVVLQSTSAQRLALATLAMLTLVLVIPLAFRLFAAVVAPYAPRSEFAFLLMVAVLCAYATRRLGVYYLVGAFLVGVAAQRFRARLPAMSSEKMVDALEAFGSVFIPFYFFNAGSHVNASELSLTAFGIAGAFLLVIVPLRVGVTSLHRRLLLREEWDRATRVSIALVPTLVFTLVLAGILRDVFHAPEYLIGALVIYTIVNTTLPAFFLRTVPPEFEHVQASTVGPISDFNPAPSTAVRSVESGGTLPAPSSSAPLAPRGPS
jgi:Kef-type K+ transport system membrane component KefB